MYGRDNYRYLDASGPALQHQSPRYLFTLHTQCMTVALDLVISLTLTPTHNLQCICSLAVPQVPAFKVGGTRLCSL